MNKLFLIKSGFANRGFVWLKDYSVGFTRRKEMASLFDKVSADSRIAEEIDYYNNEGISTIDLLFEVEQDNE